MIVAIDGRSRESRSQQRRMMFQMEALMEVGCGIMERWPYLWMAQRARSGVRYLPKKYSARDLPERSSYMRLPNIYISTLCNSSKLSGRCEKSSSDGLHGQDFGVRPWRCNKSVNRRNTPTSEIHAAPLLLTRTLSSVKFP